MRKTISTLLMTILLGSLNANASFSCFDDFTLTGQFLWWKAESEDFNTSLDFRTEVSGPLIRDTTYRSYSFGWSPGFEIEAKTQLRLCDVVYAPYCNFTHFRSTDNQAFTVTPVGEDFYTLILLDKTFVNVGGGNQLDYSGAADFLYNRLDIGLSKVVWDNCYYTIVPKFAFTYVHTRQTMEERVSTSAFNALLRTPIGKSFYSGCGITLGMDVDYGITEGFSIYGNLALTGLWGTWTFETQSREFDNLTNQLTATLEGRQKTSEGRWLSDIQVGLQYHACLWRTFNMAGRIGWEFVYLPDQVNFKRFLDPVAIKMNGLVVGLDIGF